MGDIGQSIDRSFVTGREKKDLTLVNYFFIGEFQLNPCSLSASNASNLVFLLAQFLASFSPLL